MTLIPVSTNRSVRGSADMEDTLQTVRELATHASDIKHLQDDMDKLVKDVLVKKINISNFFKILFMAKI